MKKLLIGALLLSFSSVSLQAQNEKTWTLQTCIDYAIEHNLSVKQQEDNVEQQRLSLSTAKNSRLPDLNANAGESFGFGRGLTADNTYANRNTQSTNFGLNTSIPLITGGQIPAEIQIRRLGLEAAMADLSKARESVALQVISAYLEAIYQQDLVDVAKRQLQLSDEQVKRTQLLYDNSKATAVDLAQIKATKANDETSLTQQENNLQIAILALSQLLELDKPDGMKLQRPELVSSNNVVLPSPDVVYSEALGVKPLISAEQIRLKSAEKNVTLAKSRLYPSLYFSAGLGSNYYKTSGFPSSAFGKQLKDNFSQSLSLNLSVPIFNRFQTRNNIRAAKLSVHTQELQLEQTRKSLYKEIQQAYYNAVGAQRQCLSTEASLNASQEAFTLMTKKYENGKANVTEYQESKTSLMKAESNAIQAKYTFLFRQKILEFYRTAL